MGWQDPLPLHDIAGHMKRWRDSGDLTRPYLECSSGLPYQLMSMRDSSHTFETCGEGGNQSELRLRKSS